MSGQYAPVERYKWPRKAPAVAVKICAFGRVFLDITKELKDNHSVTLQGNAWDHSDFSQSREERQNQKDEEAERAPLCQITKLVTKTVDDRALSVEKR